MAEQKDDKNTGTRQGDKKTTDDTPEETARKTREQSAGSVPKIPDKGGRK